MRKNILCLMMTVLAAPVSVLAMDTDTNSGEHAAVSDGVIAQQRETLEQNTAGKGFGPQAPRDLDSAAGSNAVSFSMAPAYTEMNLCNIHFHKNAEHKGGEFTKYAGNGDGQGYGSGFKYSGQLTETEMAPVVHQACSNEHGGLQSGDTIEVHYVYSTADVKPGPTLAACLNEVTNNPQLRVETQVYALVNDPSALDFIELADHGEVNGYEQALGIPANTGEAIQYAGSTTGPTYNEQGSPFQVTWSVRPEVAKVDINSVGEWCKGNVFDEDHAHGVRNLVKNPSLLSEID